MKRCPLCGKEYEQEDMCPECRVMLIDTATNTAVAKEPEKKSRMNREKKPIPKGYIMAAVLVVVIVLVIAAAVFMVSNTRAKKEAEQRMQAQAAAEVEQQDNQDDKDIVEDTDISEAENDLEEGENTNIPVISMDHVEDVMASSELSESNMTHFAGRVLDGDPDTAWVEGAAGQGIGETLVLTFDGTYQVSGLRICAGYQKNDYVYYNNSRPETISVEFSDGSVENYSLADVYDQEQVVTFSTPKETSYIRIIINSVYPGTKYEDTCISEIKLF